MPSESHQSQWSALSESAMFRDYQSAFEKATGLPLSLQLPESARLNRVMIRPTVGNSFCALVTHTNRGCAACFDLQKRVEEQSTLKPTTLTCFAGLCETAVPVRLGQRVIAFLLTGGVLIESQNSRQFSKTKRKLLRLSQGIDLKQAEEAYYSTRVLPPDQYESVVRLLTIFAGHLATCGSRPILWRAALGNDVIGRARHIIDESFREDLSLGAVAHRVNVSAGYFSMMFKRTTGMNFIDYVARVRIEYAKHLLQNVRLRVSEVAYDVGFQSISQFNRAFRRIVGESPRGWRAGTGDRRKSAALRSVS